MLRVIRADEAVLAESQTPMYTTFGGATSEGRTRANMNPNLGHPFVIEMTTEEIKTQSLLSCNTKGQCILKRPRRK